MRGPDRQHGRMDRPAFVVLICRRRARKIWRCAQGPSVAGSRWSRSLVTATPDRGRRGGSVGRWTSSPARQSPVRSQFMDQSDPIRERNKPKRGLPKVGARVSRGSPQRKMECRVRDGTCGREPNRQTQRDPTQTVIPLSVLGLPRRPQCCVVPFCRGFPAMERVGFQQSNCLRRSSTAHQIQIGLQRSQYARRPSGVTAAGPARNRGARVSDCGYEFR